MDNYILAVDIELNKEGEINNNVFEEPFPSYYDELISLNITDKNKNLIGNYTSDIDMCNRDNKKVAFLVWDATFFCGYAVGHQSSLESLG